MKLSKIYKIVLYATLILLFGLCIYVYTDSVDIHLVQNQIDTAKHEVFDIGNATEYLETYKEQRNKNPIFSQRRFYYKDLILYNYMVALSSDEMTDADGYYVDGEFVKKSYLFPGSYDRINTAYDDLIKYEPDFLSDAQYAVFIENLNRIRNKYRQYLEFDEELEARKVAVEPTPKPHPDMPYIGMPSDLLNETKLGKASYGGKSTSIVKDYNIWKGEYETKVVESSKYYYYASPTGNRIVFIANVYDGEVVEVTKLWNPNTDPLYNHSSSASYSDEYPDAEEYYYWNYDDLYDYEEAEDLY